MNQFIKNLDASLDMSAAKKETEHTERNKQKEIKFYYYYYFILKLEIHSINKNIKGAKERNFLRDT
jgi:hypothetical protein